MATSEALTGANGALGYKSKAAIFFNSTNQSFFLICSHPAPLFLPLSWLSAWLCSEVFLESDNPVSLTLTLTAKDKRYQQNDKSYHNLSFATSRWGQFGEAMAEQVKD